MLKLLLGVAVEVLVAMLVAGLIVALAIPLLDRTGVVAVGDAASRFVIIGVLAVAVAVALLRSRSAIQRHFKR